MTPENPIISPKRSIPTLSLNTNAELKVTVIGKICRIAVTLANGMCITAVKKKYAVTLSITERKKIFHLSLLDTRNLKTPIYTAKINNNVVVKMPRRNNI